MLLCNKLLFRNMCN